MIKKDKEGIRSKKNILLEDHTSYSGFTMKNTMRNNLSYKFLLIEEENDDKGPMLKAFGKNLKNLREGRGFTQERLGELSKINYKYIGEIERGEKNPTAVVIYKLSQALGAAISEILSVEDCPCTTAKVNMLREVERLFSGKEKRDIKKACKILRVFFE